MGAVRPGNNVWPPTRPSRVYLAGHARSVKRRIVPLVARALAAATEPIDVAIITPVSVDEFAYFARKVRPRLRDDAIVWAVIPTERATFRAECTAGEAALVAAAGTQGLVLSHRRSIAADLEMLGFVARRRKGVGSRF